MAGGWRSDDAASFLMAGQQYLPPHLARLESEAIGIIREVVASFRRPVMLYSIGKDSGLMLPGFLHLPLPRGTSDAAAIDAGQRTP